MEERNDTMDLNFEDRLRTLILSNGLPGQSPRVNPDDNDTTKPALTGYLPPHLLTASRTEQQEYITKHKENEDVSTPTLPKARRKLTQAERKRGVSNLLDLSKPASEVEGTSSQALAQPYSIKDSNVRARSSSPQATSSAVPPRLSCFSGGSPASSICVATSIDYKQTRMPPQSSAGFVHSPAGPSNSPQGRANPGEGRSNFTSGPSHSQSRFSHQPVNGPHYTGHHRTFSVQPNGSYQASLNIHSPHQPPRNFPPRNSSNYVSPPNLFPRPNGQFPPARQPPPPNRQLFNPNPQQFHHSDPQDIPVPGHMQVEYLEQVAAAEIAKAEITSEELLKKEEFRLELHNVCQWAVTAYEQKKDTSFDARTVALKCFGSLSSGFATHGSDMDLVLVSPRSSPDAASPDSEIPRLLEKVLLNEGYGARLLTRTRVPIIRLCEKPTADLKKALLEERAKWEADRDLAAAQKVEKKQKRKARAEAQKVRPDGNHPGETTPTTPKAHPKTEEAALSASESSSLKSGKTEDDHLLEEGDTPLSIHAQELEGQANSNGQSDNVIQATENTGEANQEHNQGVLNETRVQGQNSITELAESDQTTLVDEIDKPMEDDKYNPQDIPQLDGGEARPARKLKEALQKAPGGKSTPVRPKPPQPVRTDVELVQLYTLAMAENWFDDAERKIIFRFMNSVKKPNDSRAAQELEEARTALSTLPDVLSRYREKPQDKHLDFPKEGVGIQCDINFSNHLALHNTQLLRCYSHCDPRVRPMVLFVKAWAKKRKINSPYHGTLSSYGYVLMVLHYFINVAVPPVVPNLQLAWQAPPKESAEEAQCNGYDVRFWRAEKEIRLAAHRGMLTQNRQPLGFLLRGFFQYYSQEGRGVPCGGFSWSRSVISIRTNGGLLSKQEKGWVEARTEIIEPVIAGQKPKEIRHRYLLTIEDPFELEHNVARPVPHHGICAIRDEFRRANRLTQNAGFVLGAKVDLFEEGQEHIQERLFFGPNPARLTRPRRGGPQNPVTPNGKAEGQQGITNGVGNKPNPQKPNNIPAVAARSGMPNETFCGGRDRTQATRDDQSFLGVVSDAGVGDGSEGVAGEEAEVAKNGYEVVHVPGSPQSLKEDMRG